MPCVTTEIPAGYNDAFKANLAIVLREWLSHNLGVHDELVNQTPEPVVSSRVRTTVGEDGTPKHEAELYEDIEVNYFRVEDDGKIVFAILGESDPLFMKGQSARAVVKAAIPGCSIEGGVMMHLERTDGTAG